MTSIYCFPNNYKSYFQSVDQTLYPELPGIKCTKSEKTGFINVQVFNEYLLRHCDRLLIEKALESLTQVLEQEIKLKKNNTYLADSQKAILERDKEKLLHALHNYIEYSNPLAKFVGGYHRLKVLCRIVTITLIIIGACADLFAGGVMSALIGILIGVIPELISLRISFVDKNIKAGAPLRSAMKNLASNPVVIDQSDESQSCVVQKTPKNENRSEKTRFIPQFFSPRQNDTSDLNVQNSSQPLTSYETMNGILTV